MCKIGFCDNCLLEKRHIDSFVYINIEAYEKDSLFSCDGFAVHRLRGCQKAEVAGTLVVTVPEDYHEESGAIVYVFPYSAYLANPTSFQNVWPKAVASQENVARGASVSFRLLPGTYIVTDRKDKFLGDCATQVFPGEVTNFTLLNIL